MDELTPESVLREMGGSISHRQAVSGDYQIIDVRSAPEYGDGSMPGAVNLPLFDENERSTIGTIYHHGSRQEAIAQGFAFASDKLSALLEGFAPYRSGPLAIFCARGGMRSRSVVNLLLMRGFQAVQIEGGYKAYRHDTLATLADFAPRLIVLHGLTGTGKTRILQHLDGAIDLEALAGHRSSLFGGLGMQMSTQKQFEASLVQRINELGEEPYFIEGESRKIGRVFNPKALAQAMKQGILVNLDCSLETRISRIIEDYPVDAERREEIMLILGTLKRKMGKGVTEKMQRLLVENKLRELVRILLLEYYDKRYGRSMQNYQFDLELSSENIQAAARELAAFRQGLWKTSGG
jgi:tRNA 2-selenouridine synthase